MSAAKAKAKVKITPKMYDAIVSPVITEKSQRGVEQNKITFHIAPSATKDCIKSAVEALFEVKVEKVNVINIKGKVKRFRGTIGKRNDVRKAVVTLVEGQSIDTSAKL